MMVSLHNIVVVPVGSALNTLTATLQKSLTSITQ